MQVLMLSVVQAFVLGIDVSRIKVVKIVAGSVILDYLSE